jgi:hypothetical protein
VAVNVVVVVFVEADTLVAVVVEGHASHKVGHNPFTNSWREHPARVSGEIPHSDASADPS